MKKIAHYCFIVALTFLLILPNFSMAQTPLKLRFMTETGDMITANEPRIKNFFMSSDGILGIILKSDDGGLNFTFAEDETRIGIRNGNNCTIPGDGTVTATAGNTFSFEVYSDSSGATLSAPALPGGSFTGGSSPKTYQWVTTEGDIGTYLAVFEASASGLKTSQIVVMIKIVSSTQYTLTVNVSPAGYGTVTKNPDKTSYTSGETVQLTANANSGYAFSNWSGDASGSTNPYTITMNGNKSVTANFSTAPPSTYTLTVNVSPTGYGSVTKNPDKSSYSSGETVQLTANANSGYIFNNWSGDASGSTNPYTITMNGNKSVTANFSQSGTGPWCDERNGAMPIDNFVVYLFKENAAIQAYGTHYFRINPKAYGATYAPYLRIGVRDPTQGQRINIGNPIAYKLDANCSELGKYTLTGSGDFAVTIQQYTQAEFDSNVEFLLEIIEKAGGTETIEIYWRMF